MTGYANQWESQGYTDLLDRDDEIAAYMLNRKSSVRTKSWRQLGTALRHFRDFIDERGLSPGDIDDDAADELVDWLKAKDSINDETTKAYLNRISHMYDYAIRRRRSEAFSDIDYNPIAIVIEDVSDRHRHRRRIVRGRRNHRAPRHRSQSDARSGAVDSTPPVTVHHRPILEDGDPSQ